MRRAEVKQSATRMTNDSKQASTAWQHEEIREQLLIEQLPQVRYIAQQIRERLPRHVLLDDLVHAGVVGLIDALKKFDCRKHVQFGSYAKFRIRGAILDSLREMDWGPRDLRRQARRIEEASQKLRAVLGRNPTEPELAHELELNLPQLQKLFGDIDALEIGSLRIVSPDDGRELDLCECLSGDNGDDPLTECLRSEMKNLLSRAISELAEKERQVLTLYYFEERTMKEIGATLGVGESRVSQIHAAAVLRLRTQMANLNSGTLEKRHATGAQ
jgi:RNA polymerase sigma factor FliA